jgi:hypothetical protein
MEETMDLSDKIYKEALIDILGSEAAVAARIVESKLKRVKGSVSVRSLLETAEAEGWKDSILEMRVRDLASFVLGEKSEKSAAVDGKRRRTSKDDLAACENRIKDTLRSNQGGLAIGAIADSCGIGSKAAVRRVLNALVASGQIRGEGDKARRRYFIN